MYEENKFYAGSGNFRFAYFFHIEHVYILAMQMRDNKKSNFLEEICDAEKIAK